MLLKRELVSFNLTDEARDKVDALVSSVNSSYFGEEIYKTNKEKALAYLYFLIKDHPFVDGNKRTAVLVFETICELNNLNISSDFSIDAVAVFIEKIQEENHQEVIKMLSDLIFYKK